MLSAEANPHARRRPRRGIGEAEVLGPGEKLAHEEEADRSVPGLWVV